VVKWKEERAAGLPLMADTWCLWCPRCAQTAEDLIAEAIQQLDGFPPEKRTPLVALAKYIGYRQN